MKKFSDKSLMTGVLVWDLSATFDIMDIDLFVQKLTLYGANQTTKNWFESFLSGRTQRVRIGEALSSPLELVSRVPQGGILSPIVFTHCRHGAMAHDVTRIQFC